MQAIVALTILAVLVMFFGVRKMKKVLLPLLFVGLIITMILNISQWNTSVRYFNDMFIADNFSIAFSSILILIGILIFMFANIYYKGVERPLEDIYALILFALIGGIVMASFGNLILFFIGLETLSISFYVLAGSKKFDIASNEAAMKYFLTGSFATGFLLFGIALVYGASGSFNLEAINAYVISCKGTVPMLFIAGMLLIFIGMSFKIAAVPFHFWSPDVYTGSPTLITAFMTTAGKVASVAAFYRLISIAFISLHTELVATLTVLSVATIIVGNLSAVYQDNLKRMFAYSGVAQSGYLLMAMIVLGPKAAGILLFFVLSYVIATITAFAVLMLIREERGTFFIPAFRGLAKNNPVEAFAMAIAMMSLAGIPPLAGFMAKYNLFALAAEGGYTWLVVVAIIGSMISIYFYFKPIMASYFAEGEPQHKIESSINFKFNIILCTVLMIVLGFLPKLIINLL
ncbi:MAG: NADH-quinone oxidoreductase subunit N [Prolixibacteraceae bacterium]|jgi:NADH-quinone oxidoreductase subunit N|nr:NADH-quinone oxidoreductase subunit N [Prolixibacteraceae bacterium]